MASIYGDLERPPLQVDALRRALVVPGSVWTELDVVPESPSTNAALAERARVDPASGIVLLAEHQTAGRGRLDRSWSTPPRAGITMSALVRPDTVDVVRWPWLPLLAGLAVAAAVRKETSVPVGLKWPNDVVVADRKLAGLLVERVESLSATPAAVIGVGLNVSTTKEELPVPTATSLRLEGADTTDRTVLVKAVLRTLAGMLQSWQRNGGDPSHGLHASYVEACTTIGRQVEVHLPPGEVVTGHALGVDDYGRLLIRTSSGIRAIGAGDVVHVRPAS
jgi:BirA family biotin operon repressor/biotin-[acetyl-CoA-carboxylase] ligase